MKKVYIFIGALLVSAISFSQVQQKEKLRVPDFMTSVDKPQQRSSAQSEIIWQEDFDNGLDGNNSSTIPAWTTSENTTVQKVVIQ